MKVFLDHWQKPILPALLVIHWHARPFTFNVAIAVELIILERTLNRPFLSLKQSVDRLVLVKPAFKRLPWFMDNLSRALPQIICEIPLIPRPILVCVTAISLLFALLKVAFIHLPTRILYLGLSMWKAILELPSYVECLCFWFAKSVQKWISKRSFTKISILVCQNSLSLILIVLKLPIIV